MYTSVNNISFDFIVFYTLNEHWFKIVLFLMSRSKNYDATRLFKIFGSVNQWMMDQTSLNMHKGEMLPDVADDMVPGSDIRQIWEVSKIRQIWEVRKDRLRG